jgi:hypothetical protein
MWDYLKRHEAFIREQLDTPPSEGATRDWRGLAAFHGERIARMQHERLIHLLVTFFVVTYFLLVLGFVLLHPDLPGLLLLPLLLSLSAAYLLHYFRLENGVQRWYHLADRLAERAGDCGARYENGRTVPFGPGAASGARG